MRLLIVNPNTSADMTATIRATAGSAAGPGVQVEALNPSRGPASVEGQFDEVISAYWTLESVLPIAHQYDGIVLACYGHHPVIGALREALDQPVLGIMEASILHALPLGDRFSIVTSSPRWVPLLEEGVRALGVDQRCASVRSSGLAVLDIAALSDEDVAARLGAEARAAVDQDSADVICLGCAGMAGLEQAVSEATGVPVVDGVRAATILVRGLVEAGARTSKRTRYRHVEPRPAMGLSASIARIYTSGNATDVSADHADSLTSRIGTREASAGC
jgi:allantoin racemase